MKEVPNPLQPPVLPQADGSSHPIRPVSALGAALDASGGMVVVRFRDPDNQRDFPFLLSPPAAKQLAECLEKAVDDYLHSAPLPTLELPPGVSLPDLETE